MDDLNSLGSVIRKARESKGWSQTLLARKADIADASYVSRLETGNIQSPGFVQVKRIARALGIPCQDLFEEPPSRKEVPLPAKEEAPTLRQEVYVGFFDYLEYLAQASEEERRRAMDWLRRAAAKRQESDANTAENNT